MTLTRVTLILVIILSSICLMGQDDFTSLKKLNRIKLELRHAKSYEDSIRQYISIINNYLYVNPDSSIYYGYRGRALAEKEDDILNIMYITGLTGEALIYTGRLVESLNLGMEALARHDEMRKAGISHTAIGPHWYNLSEINYLLGKYKESTYYAQSMINLDHNDDEIGIPYGHYLMARNYLALDQIDKAIVSIDSANAGFKRVINLELSNTVDGTFPGVVNLQAEILIKKGRYSDALAKFNGLLRQSNRRGEFYHSAVTNLDIAELFQIMGHRDSTITYGLQGLNISNEIDYTLGQLRANNILSKAYKNSNPEIAVQYYESASQLQNDLYGLGNVELLREVVQERESQEREALLAQKESTQKRRQLILLFSLLTFASLSILFFWNAKRTKKVNNELNQTLDRLKSTQTQLIQSEKMASLGELTAGIAHEIQNPLNFVNNFSDVSSEMIDEAFEELKRAGNPLEQGAHEENEIIIKKENLDEVKDILSDLKGNLDKISHHGNRASSIVKGMLDHSRTSSDEKVPTDINALCDEYLRLSYHGLRAKDKSFNSGYETHFDDRIPLIDVVPQDVGRVLLNIINNAFYACAERSRSAVTSTSLSHRESPPERIQEQYKPMVSITTKQLSNSTTIRISNNGDPIPADALDKIFQPFFTTKPTGSGTGLGLSISYDIIKSHNGILEVSSTDEVTIFTITLPTIENKNQPT